MHAAQPLLTTTVLCRRHPACAVLLHQPEAQATPAAAADPYDATESDPARTNALGSSLWEVEALRNHYCSQASLTRFADLSWQRVMLACQIWCSLAAVPCGVCQLLAPCCLAVMLASCA